MKMILNSILHCLKHTQTNGTKTPGTARTQSRRQNDKNFTEGNGMHVEINIRTEATKKAWVTEMSIVKQKL